MKRLVTIIVAIAGVIAVPVVLLLLLLGTQSGLTLVASWVSQLASNTESRIEVSGLGGVLSGSPTVGSIELSDREGAWLTVTDAQADLEFWPLLSGRIVSSRLSADTVDLARLPVPPETNGTAPGQGGGFSLPSITANISNIFVREIRLGQPVLGEAATLQLTGSAVLGDNPVDLSGNLDVIRTDGTDGEVSAVWMLAPDANQLKLDLKVREPGDGLLARTLDIHGLPAVDLDLAGDGTLDDWNSTLSVSLDGKRTVSGQMALSYTPDRQAVSGTLNGEFARLLPQSVKPLFAGQTDIDVAIERSAGNTLRIEHLVMRSSLTSLEASGHVLPDSNAVDVKARFTFGMEGSEVAFEVDDANSFNVGYVTLQSTVTGTMDSARWDLNASISSFRDGTRSLTDIDLKASAPDLNLNRRSGDASLDLQIANIVTGQDDVDAFLSGPATVSGTAKLDGDILRLDPLRVRFDNLTAQIMGAIDTADRTAEAKLDITAQRQDTGLAAQLFGDEPVQVSGNLYRSADNEIGVRALELKSGNIGLSGDGKLAGTALNFSGNLTLADLSAFNADLKGSIAASIGVDGAVADPNFDIEATGRDISILGNALEGLSVSAKGQNAVSDLAAQLDVKGRYQNQPVVIVAAVTRGSGPIPLIENLKVDLPGMTAQGGLQPDAKGIVTGELDLDVTSLQELGPLLLRDDLNGSVTGKVVFADDNDRQAITVSLDSGDLEAVGVKLSNMKAAVDVLDPEGGLGLKVNLTADTISAQGQQVDGATVTVSGDLSRMPFSVTGRMEGAPLEVVGQLAVAGDVTTIGLDRVRLTYSSIPLSLTEPVEVDIRNGSAQLDSVELRVGEGTVNVSGTAGETLAMTVAVSRLPLSFIENVAPTGLGQQGTITATAKIDGKPSNPDVTYQLDVDSVSTEATRSMRIPLINVASTGNLSSMVLTTSTRIFGAGMDVNASGKVDLNGEPRLDIAVNGNAPFTLAAIPLANAGLELTGSADVAVDVKGSAKAPQITGRVSTRDATFIENTSELVIRDIAGQIDFTAARATIASLTGRIGNNGKMSASGFVDMNFDAGLPADITVSVVDGLYSDGNIVTAQFGTNLEVSGPLMGAGILEGTVNVQRLDIQIPDQLPSSIPVVEVRHIAPSSAVARQAEEISNSDQGAAAADPSEGLGLSLAVDAPNRIFLRGRGIDAEFGGDIKIEGTTAAPRARGSFRMIRGRMNVLTKRFTFDHGTITFAGPLDPVLDFETSVTQSGVTYSILVDGTASSPVIRFQSSPEMPQDEVLANLFFGKGLSTLSPLQIAQLAGALSELSGNGSGGGLIGGLRNFTGLDDISVGTGQNGEDTTIGIGRYLNDRTYLNVEQGITGETGQITIDVELTDHLKFRGEAGIDGNTKAGIYYERDYK